MVNPTDEQLQALQKFTTGRSLKVTAFAGAGKTTTLALLSKSSRGRGAYLAFNKSIANDAREKFPPSVDCRTTHSLAWRAVQSKFRFSSGKMNDRIGSTQLAPAFGLQDRLYADSFRLTAVQRAHLLLGTLRRFCQSADQNPTRNHVPKHGRLVGVDDQIVSAVTADTLSDAWRLWSRMIDTRDRIPLGHDGYLKLWALNHPTIEADFILLDEAQDTNHVVLGVLNEQQAQIVFVGDRHQQIYEWRGAVNAMEEMRVREEAYLTQSFRFGPDIASAASKVLKMLGECTPIRGNPRVNSVIVEHAARGTVLARTNARVMSEVLSALTQNLKPHVIGGVEDLKRLISDVFELKAGRPGTSTEFFGFQNWGEVLAFAATEEGEDIRMFVKLVEQRGEHQLWAALAKAHFDEKTADVIVSTAHKAKGREWNTVRLAPDFLSSRFEKGEAPNEAELRLFYVAMTRAKKTLAVHPTVLGAFTGEIKKGRVDEELSAFDPLDDFGEEEAQPIHSPQANGPPSLRKDASPKPIAFNDPVAKNFAVPPRQSTQRPPVRVVSEISRLDRRPRQALKPMNINTSPVDVPFKAHTAQPQVAAPTKIAKPSLLTTLIRIFRG